MSAIESECCREDALAWEPCPAFQDLQAENEALRSKLSTSPDLAAIETTIRIEFNHSEDCAAVRRTAERVFNLMVALR